jgi:hypothetical protein
MLDPAAPYIMLRGPSTVGGTLYWKKYGEIDLYMLQSNKYITCLSTINADPYNDSQTGKLAFGAILLEKALNPTDSFKALETSS